MVNDDDPGTGSISITGMQCLVAWNLQAARHGEERSHPFLEFMQLVFNNSDCFIKLRKAWNDKLSE